MLDPDLASESDIKWVHLYEVGSAVKGGYTCNRYIGDFFPVSWIFIASPYPFTYPISGAINTCLMR